MGLQGPVELRGSYLSIFFEQTLISEISEGIKLKDCVVKTGIIGEIGTSWPITDFEKRSLRATAVAQVQTQTPVMLHPAEDPEAPFEVLRLFQEAGGDAKRAVMAHMDYALPKDEQALAFADEGAFIEYDFFGSEISYLVPYMSDLQRIEKIVKLIDHGHVDKILISHDIHACHNLTKFGGIGFSHILDYSVPRMLQLGVTQANIDKMIVSNPKAWLTYY